MKRSIASILVFTLLLGITGCQQNKNTYLGNLKLSQTLYVNDEEVDPAVVGFYYGYSLTKHVNQYYSHFGKDGLPMTGMTIDEDINVLQEQTCTAEGYTEVSWERYFLEKGLEQYQEIQALYEKAIATGYTITNEETSAATEVYDSITSYCESNAIEVDSYLRSMYGKSMTKQVFINNYEKIKLAERYVGDITNIEPTAKQIESHYTTYSDEIDTVNIRYFTFLKNNEEEAKKFAEAVTSEETFKQLALAYSTDGNQEVYETSDATLRTYLQKEDLPTYLQDVAFEEENMGKTIVVEGDDSFDVVMVVSRDKPIYKEGNLTAVYLDARESDNDDLTDEKIAVCHDFAVALLEQFNSETDGSLESFYTYNKTYSDDKSNNGDYSNLSRGNMTPEIEAWLFDESREIGDRAVLASVYGYSILYFRGYGEPVYYQQARELVKERAYFTVVEEYQNNNTFTIK